MTGASPDRQLNRQEREWRRRRDEILEAATKLFLEFGDAGTTMQMIADAAEFSVGYIYKHFPSKRELLTDIIERQLQAHTETRRRVRDQYRGRPLAGLREELRQVCGQLAEQAQLVSLILGSGAIDAELIRRRLRGLRAEDAGFLAQAMELGELRRTDPRLLAATLDGVIWGLIRLLSETGRLDEAPAIPGIVEDLVLGPLACPPDANE